MEDLFYMYMDSINSDNNFYALSSFGNVLICSDSISNPKTVTFPNGYNLDTNLAFKVVFVNGHNCVDDSTPMTLNGVPVVVNKFGTLIPLPIHEMDESGTTVYKSVMPNCVLEMYYTSNYDGNNNPAFVVIGNPVVLSSADYTIYADGFNEQEYIRNQNELSDMEVIRKGTSGTDIIDTSNYDGILYVNGHRSSGFGGVYTITLTIDASTSYVLRGSCDGGNQQSTTYPFKKGDNLETWVDKNDNKSSFVGVRYYKLRDYSGRN